MEICKKELSELRLGDILILDWEYLDEYSEYFLSHNLPIESLTARMDSRFILFEIDDIVIEDLEGTDCEMYIFYNIFGEQINFVNIEFELDVIKNPWETLEHYKEMVKCINNKRNKLNPILDEINDGLL
jgi:hypothetical protein